jgi:hypothetical protein
MGAIRSCSLPPVLLSDRSVGVSGFDALAAAAGQDLGCCSGAPVEADSAASWALLKAASDAVARLRRSTTVSIGEICPFEAEMGREATGRLSINPKAATAVSDTVPPARIDPRRSGSLSRTLKNGVPSAFGENDIASVVAYEFRYACGSPTKRSVTRSHQRRALSKKPASSQRRSRINCRASCSYSLRNLGGYSRSRRKYIFSNIIPPQNLPGSRDAQNIGHFLGLRTRLLAADRGQPVVTTALLAHFSVLGPFNLFD